MSDTNIVPVEQIQSRILVLRGVRVLLDADLAVLYGVPTFRFNEAVKRNADRFPEDFRFQLTPEEFANLISQIAISSSDPTTNHPLRSNSSQTAMRARQPGGRRKRPWAFTEHGALMAATILNSARAVQMSLVVIRAFVQLRLMLVNHKALAAKLAELDQRVGANEADIAAIVEAIRQLTTPDAPTHGRRIGFQPATT